MARNGSGTMAIVNSFSPATTISSSDMNENFTDIGSEITNSVAKDGQTTMTGVLKLANGAVGNPSLTFGSDLNMGLYRKGADNLGLALNGALVVEYTTTGVSITGTLTPSGQIVGSAGTKTAPGYAFASDLDTGIYRLGADNIGISCADTKIVDIATTGVGVTGTFSASGAATLSSTLALTGNLAINTDKFTVTAASGNTAVGGTLAVTGAATLSSTLAVTGAVNASTGISSKNTAKAFATFTLSGTTVSYTASTQGFNIATITRTDEGVFDVAFTSALATANFIVLANGNAEGSNNIMMGLISSRATTGFTVTFRDGPNSSITDPDYADIVVFGF